MNGFRIPALLRPLLFVASLIAAGCGGNPLVPKVEEAPADASKTGQANLLLFPIEDIFAKYGWGTRSAHPSGAGTSSALVPLS